MPFTCIYIHAYESAAAQCHYLNPQLHYSPASPQGGQLNTHNLSWSHDGVILSRCSIIHPGRTVQPLLPPVFPLFFFLLLFPLNDGTKSWHRHPVETMLDMSQPSDSSGTQREIIVISKLLWRTVVAKVKVVAVILHRDQRGLTVWSVFKWWFIRRTNSLQNQFRPASHRADVERNYQPASDLMIWLFFFFSFSLLFNSHSQQSSTTPLSSLSLCLFSAPALFTPEHEVLELFTSVIFSTVLLDFVRGLSFLFIFSD